MSRADALDCIVNVLYKNSQEGGEWGLKSGQYCIHLVLHLGRRLSLPWGGMRGLPFPNSTKMSYNLARTLPLRIPWEAFVC